MDKSSIMAEMQKICDRLFKTAMLENKILIKETTVAIGKESEFDSIGFVTFFMELEEKISELKGEDVCLMIDEIREIYKGERLTIGNLTEYILENI